MRGCVTLPHSPFSAPLSRVPLIYLFDSCPPAIPLPSSVHFLILFLSPFLPLPFLPIKNDMYAVMVWKAWGFFWYILKFLLLTPRGNIYFSEMLLP